MPAMTFIGNLVYVGIAVVGGLQVASGAMQLGDVQAFIQYSRQFTQPLTQVASMMNVLQSGVASAERIFELLDAGRAGIHLTESCAMTPAASVSGIYFAHPAAKYFSIHALVFATSKSPTTVTEWSATTRSFHSNATPLRRSVHSTT